MGHGVLKDGRPLLAITDHDTVKAHLENDYSKYYSGKKFSGAEFSG